ncbi:MAG: ribosome maturation factor RimM [Bacillota bacterium]|nr:ribosome maturation factor RimM [Bacillota bacterium]
MTREKENAAIGKILSPHGTGGLLKVYPYSDFPERLKLLTEVTLVLDARTYHLVVEKGALYGRFWLIKFKGIDTREEAQTLNGSLIMIPLDQRIALPEGSFYHDQLVGLRVYNMEEELLGVITDIIATGGHDVYLVSRKKPGKKDLLIPGVKKIIRQVDLENLKMIVELPEGLLEI